MKKLLFCLLILLYSQASIAQYTTPDEIAKYKQLAENGNLAAMGYLADMYARGEETIPIDCPLALKYYNIAVEKGDSSCMVNLGNLYLFGNCVPVDYNKAEELYLMASKKGNTLAYFALGMMNEAGMGRPANYEKALEWYFKTAELGKGEFREEGYTSNGGHIIFELLAYAKGLLYKYDSTNKFQRIDLNKTFDAFKQAAEKGNKYAMLAISDALLNGAITTPDTAKGLDWLLKSANAGNVIAMYELGIMSYEKGNYPGPHDNIKAAKWFLKAAENGYVNGMTHIATMYYYGRGVKQDYNKAIEWYEKAAAKGNPLSMNNLGLMYMTGEGVKQDYAKAVNWLKKATDLNYSNSMVYLGIAYEKGTGVETDYKKAMDLYMKAAEMGNEAAMEGIGHLYEDGKGVPQDYAKAAHWFAKMHH